jgi:hypothetical protein
LLREGLGLYLVDIDAQEAAFLQDMYADLWWDRYERRFLIAGDLGFFSVTVDGILTPDATTTSRVSSPDGRFSAWFDSAPRAGWNGELWLKTGDAELKKVLEGGGLSLEWSPDSRSFFYDLGSIGLYLVVVDPLEVIALSHWPNEISEVQWTA